MRCFTALYRSNLLYVFSNKLLSIPVWALFPEHQSNQILFGQIKMATLQRYSSKYLKDKYL